MKTYIVKVALRGISPMVWHRFRLSGETSLAAFRYIIQSAQGWPDDHLHQCRIILSDSPGHNFRLCFNKSESATLLLFTPLIGYAVI
ncbi:plasmid pRiA4b ORF-3 family protein [Xenorhabdus sp. XENO-1]|uniref:plasmid pRiA4b ORF-3 family protein n=1 Tax=Xenorhabdus bovienii TaxID=40576 RepID=UPI0020CA59E4|nr:plasmid pRiA4b ORF-3 family protein [Xenorhabdus bovienii]MCP9269396.1 plasmid pRiA4b ORF-3 family protein [Xenorhabdus bovienii subsp. africana]